MNKKLTPWILALVIMALAMGARYGMIQPPDVAHQCDDGAGPWWCSLRLAIILMYAHYGLGYASLLLSAGALALRRVDIACITICVGLAALVLYCYEPGAVAVVIGVLRLARAQTQNSPDDSEMIDA
jgi:hypothetical protein